MYFNWEWVIVVDPTAYKIPQLRTPSTQPGADYLEEPHFPAAVVRLATQDGIPMDNSWYLTIWNWESFWAIPKGYERFWTTNYKWVVGTLR